MHIKRFEGKSLAELLEKIRTELGEDALILETRTSKRGRVEVMAARPHANEADRPPASSTMDPAGSSAHARGVAQTYARLSGAPNPRSEEEPAAPEPRMESAISRMAQILSRMPKPKPEPSPARTASDSSEDAVRWRAAADAAAEMSDRRAAADAAAEMSDRRTASAPPEVVGATSADPSEESAQHARIEYLGRLVRSEHFSAIPLPLRELYLDLVDAEIDANLVFQILSKMGHAPMPGQFATAPPDQLLALLRKLVRAGGAVQAGGPKRMMALVGPTGVGKTTTVAKIAAHAAFHLKQRVVLVSTDSYRIFGAQHLASYAALMGLEFENVTDTAALREVIARHSENCDLLLIDTSGRSPRDPEGIAETERLLAACPDLDIHLVLAANARVRDQALALERFSTLPIRHLIFTKLDETTRRGGLFTVALKAARPVSYLGIGQEVPDDLEEASIAGLTEVIAETLQKETVHA